MDLARPRRIAGLAVVATTIVLLTVGCGADPAAPVAAAAATPSEVSTPANAPTTPPTGSEVPPTSRLPGSSPATTSTEVNQPPLTTTTSPALLPAPNRCPKPTATTTTPRLRAAEATTATAATEQLAPALDALAHAGSRVSVSVAAEDLGLIAEHHPTDPLVPASNQKLVVAIAVFERFGESDHLTTTLVGTGPVVAGELRGDLVLVAGGDPLLEHTGGHSVDTLTAQLKARGIRRVTGRLLIDESRFDSLRTAPGWPDALWPTTVGPLTAFPIDHNRVNANPAFLTDPALVGAVWLKDSLMSNGVEVTGVPAYGTAARGEVLATLDSASLPALAALMLTRSDNLTAELLLKELGRRRSGAGTTAAGLTAAAEVAASLCVTLDGQDHDASGLSSTDSRSADSWRRLLTAAKTRPWWPAFRNGLAHAGQSGTLAGRLKGPATLGKVQAKTGSTALARALSGYLTTAGGRPIVFSIVVNGPGPKAEDLIDAFVTDLASLP